MAKIEVEAWDCQEYFQDHEEYQVDDVAAILESLQEKAKAQGLTNTYFKFNSHMEPYEDWLGLPSVSVWGYRDKTVDEKLQEEEDKMALALSRQKGITLYEAHILMDLAKRGKILDGWGVIQHKEGMGNG